MQIVSYIMPSLYFVGVHTCNHTNFRLESCTGGRGVVTTELRGFRMNPAGWKQMLRDSRGDVKEMRK